MRTLRSVLSTAARGRPVIRRSMERIARELQEATRGGDGVDRGLVAIVEQTEQTGLSAQPWSPLNRLCGPDAWDDPTWLMYNRALGMPQGEHRFHRKAFEWTQCVYGLERLGVLGPDVRALGVAAGHECVLYYLANRCAEVVATDLYAGDFAGGMAAEAAGDFLTHPSRYAPFPYRESALRPMAADALDLPFDDASFDVVYSLSSIEHFGGHDASARGMREMTRVLRPGGVLCVATEWILAGGDDPEFFTTEALRTYVVDTPGLELIGPLDDRPPPPALIADPIWTDGDRERTPHIVLGRGPLRWTSVVLFLRRQDGARED